MVARQYRRGNTAPVDAKQDQATVNHEGHLTVRNSVKQALHIFAILAFCTPSHAATLSGHVVRVIDGDTIVVLDDNNAQHKIRLQGIDAPETGQAYGTKSKEHLADSVAGEIVVVEYDKNDRYGQVLGKVLLGGEDMNLEQVKAGLAWHYRNYQEEQTVADRVKYSDAEMDARRHERGLWEDPDHVPPWDYRKAKREQKRAMEAFTIRTKTRDSPY